MKSKDDSRMTFALAKRDTCNMLNCHYLREGIRMKRAAKGSFFKYEWLQDYEFLEQQKGTVLTMDIVRKLDESNILQPDTEEHVFRKHFELYMADYFPGGKSAPKDKPAIARTIVYDPSLYSHVQLKPDSEVKRYFLNLAIEALEKSMTYVYNKNPYWEIHNALEELMIVYHAAGDIKNEIRITQRAVELRPSDTNYTKRLNKLLGKDASLTIPPEPYIPIRVKKDLGEEYERLFRQKPEYNFRIDGINHLLLANGFWKVASDWRQNKKVVLIRGEETVQIDRDILFECEKESDEDMYLEKDLPMYNLTQRTEWGQSFRYEYVLLPGDKKRDIMAPLRKIHNHFSRQLVDGEKEERKFNYKKAADIYETSSAEGSFIPTTYDRLISIYRKYKMYDEEYRVIRCAIGRFSTLEKQRKEWVIGLAKKYGVEETILKLLSQNTSAIVSYYDNTVIYQSFVSNLLKWEDQLRKISKQ